MHRQKVILKSRLVGISQTPRRAVAPEACVSPQPLPTTQPAPALVSLTQEIKALGSLLTELGRLAQEIQSRERHTSAEIAQASVELGAAIAERLLAGEIAANRQRLDRIVAMALERMPAARFVVVQAHPEDVALLKKLVDQQADLERFRDLLTFRAEETLQRGQLKLEADEWFVEWDTQRSLADVRAALLEETFVDE